MVSSQLGTCSMKRREERGVVDSRLNVYGVEGLKIAGTSSNSPATMISGVRVQHAHSITSPTDLSICPGNVAAVSTCAPTPSREQLIDRHAFMIYRTPTPLRSSSVRRPPRSSDKTSACPSTTTRRCHTSVLVSKLSLCYNTTIIHVSLCRCTLYVVHGTTPMRLDLALTARRHTPRSCP